MACVQIKSIASVVHIELVELSDSFEENGIPLPYAEILIRQLVGTLCRACCGHLLGTVVEVSTV